MKKRRTRTSFVLVLCMLFSLISTISGSVSKAAGNPYPTQQNVDGDAYYEVPCTWFAWQQVYDNQGISMPAWGNGGQWFDNAKRAGYETGTEPKPGSVACWSGGLGHVAYVTGGSGSTFTVNEGGRTDLDQTDSHGVAYGYTLRNHAVGTKRPYDESKTLLGFIYLKGNVPSSITFSEQKIVSTSTTNAVVYTKINNPSRLTFSSVGCHLYNESGQLIKSYSETCTLSTSYVNYNCDFNSDMKITLEQGKTYKYVLYAVVAGKEYKDSMRSFKTNAPTPDIESITFKNQKVNYVTSNNAELYVYIDNPNRLSFSEVGCILSDSSGNTVKDYTESCTLSTSYVNYTCNINSDMKFTLQPGTTYNYVLFARAGGKEYKDSPRSFTTTPDGSGGTTTPSPTPIETGDVNAALTWATGVAQDDSHGYSQSIDRRWGNPDYDCSSFVISAFKYAGFNVGSAVNTGDMRAVFEAAGFTWIPRSVIALEDSSHLRTGDILLRESVHTEIYLGNNSMVGAHGGSYSKYDETDPGDSSGEEISIVMYSDKSWDGVLRYGTGGNDPVAPTVSPAPTATPSDVTPTPTPTPTIIPTATPTHTPIHTQEPDDPSEDKIKIPSKPVIKYVESEKKHEVIIKWKKTKYAKVYYIHCARNKKNSWQKMTKKTTCKIKGLKSKKYYYIKIRARNSDYDLSHWSKIWKVKIR